MAGRSAVVAGATGLVGRSCLALLIDSVEYDRVVALVRRPAPVESARLEQRITDFDGLATADLAVTDVYCSLGTTIRKAGTRVAFARVDRDYVVALARRSLECGAARFLLVSSVGAGATSANFYLRIKGETESAVAALPFSAVHIFRPSILMGPREEKRGGERVGIAVARLARPLLVGRLRKYRPIASEQVAGAMLAAALKPLTGVHIWEHDDMMKLL